jgi:hypothetical protein
VTGKGCLIDGRSRKKELRGRSDRAQKFVQVLLHLILISFRFFLKDTFKVLSL